MQKNALSRKSTPCKSLPPPSPRLALCLSPSGRRPRLSRSCSSAASPISLTHRQ
jgi:hypothetical protein